MPSSSYNLQDSLYCSPVNNTGQDPLQGFDFEVWVQDTCTGLLAWFGKFQSLTLSIRNATETYLELGQRIPIHLDGEIQIAWVLEQGMVDFNFVHRTFGVPALRRDSYITRGPRFQISFDVNAQELEYVNRKAPEQTGRVGNGNFDRAINQTPQPGTSPIATAKNVNQQSLHRFGSDEYFAFGNNMYAGGNTYTAKAVGRYDVMRAKVDNVSMGLMPGRRVAALRWEGVAEGITFVDKSVQEFKTQRFENFAASGGGFLGREPVGLPPEPQIDFVR